jgi:hypothetical protein
MRRREFIGSLIGTAVAWPTVARAIEIAASSRKQPTDGRP